MLGFSFVFCFLASRGTVKSGSLAAMLGGVGDSQLLTLSRRPHAEQGPVLFSSRGAENVTFLSASWGHKLPLLERQ